MDTSVAPEVVVAILLFVLLLSLSFPSVSPPVATSESPFPGGLPPPFAVSDDGDDDDGCFEDCVELLVFGAAARAPGDDTDDVVGLDCAGFAEFLVLLLMHLPNALLLILLFVLELFKFFADDVAAANRDE